MKKLIYGTLFLAVVGIGVLACDKPNKISQSKYEKFIETTDNKASIDNEFYEKELKNVEIALRLMLCDSSFKNLLNNTFNSIPDTRDNYINFKEVVKNHENEIINLITENIHDTILQQEILKSVFNEGLSHKNVSWSIYIPYFDENKIFKDEIYTSTRTISNEDVLGTKLNESFPINLTENTAQQSSDLILCINGIQDADNAGILNTGFAHMPWHRCSCGRMETTSIGSCKEAYGEGCNGKCGRSNFRGICPGTPCATC